MENTCQFVLFDNIEHMREIEAGKVHEPDLETDTQGEVDVDCYSARVGGRKHPWEGGLEAF